MVVMIRYPYPITIMLRTGAEIIDSMIFRFNPAEDFARIAIRSSDLSHAGAYQKIRDSDFE